MIRKFGILGFALFLLGSCYKETDPILVALQSEQPKIKRVVDSLENFEVQILFTKVERDSEGLPYFTDYSFQVDDSSYFYPASTVKFPVALFALEKLGENQLSRDSRFFVEGDSVVTTFSKEVEQIFTVSANDAYNRLFEYLGQDAINERLAKQEVTGRISHRLSVDDSENITTKPLVIYRNDSTLMTTKEIYNTPIQQLVLKKLLKGNGFIQDGALVQEPKDFGTRNYLPVSSLHKMMKQLMFPELFPPDKQFHLSDEDREFVLHAMKTYPKDAGFDPNEYYDSYGKFFIYGDSREPIPSHMEIYNKVGYAYGYLTDCAYIIDTERNKEYIITATIYVNKNGIFNDDVYEYETIGLPFLAELGRQLVKF